LLFALDKIYTLALQDHARVSHKDQVELRLVVDQMKVQIDKIVSYRAWGQEAISDRAHFEQEALKAIDEISTGVIFADTRTRLRQMVRDGSMIAKIQQDLDALQRDGERAKEELDKGLAELKEAGSSGGDLWSRFACELSGVGTALCINAVNLCAVAGVIAMVANCIPSKP
jgi:hypothetical protein